MLSRCMGHMEIQSSSPSPWALMKRLDEQCKTKCVQSNPSNANQRGASVLAGGRPWKQEENHQQENGGSTWKAKVETHMKHCWGSRTGRKWEGLWQVQQAGKCAQRRLAREGRRQSAVVIHSLERNSTSQKTTGPVWSIYLTGAMDWKKQCITPSNFLNNCICLC